MAAERRYVLEHTTTFADQRVVDAEKLRESLSASVSHGTSLGARLVGCASAAVAMRAQARAVYESASGRAATSAATANEAATVSAAVAGEECQEVLRMIDALAESGTSQQALLRSFADSIREGSKRLVEDLGAESVRASEATASEQATMLSHIASIEAALSALEAASAEGQAAISLLAKNGQERLGEQVSTLQAELGTGAVASAARAVATDLDEARSATAAAEEAAGRHLGETVRDRLVDLSGAMSAFDVDLDAHGCAAAAGKTQGELDAEAAAARRALLACALGEASESLAASTALPEPVLQALGALDRALTTGCGTLEGELGSLVARTGEACASLAEGDARGESAVHEAISAADRDLQASWADGSHRLATVRALLDRDQQDGADGVAAGVPLALLLTKVVSALDASREEVAAEVSALRMQRSEEQRILEEMAEQRETLRRDIAAAEAKLVGVTADLESGQAMLIEMEAEQAQTREQTLRTVVAGMEDLLRGQLDSLGQQLATKSRGAAGKITAATHGVAATIADVTAAEERVVASCDKVGQAVGSLTSAVETSSDSISIAQEASAQATELLRIDAASSVSSLVDRVNSTEEAMNHSIPRWAAARESGLAAATLWREDGQAVEKALREGQEGITASIASAAELHANVSVQRCATESHVGKWADAGTVNASLVSGVLGMQAEHSQLDGVALEEQGRSLVALVQGATSLSSGLARLSPELPHALEAMDAHAEAAAKDGQAHRAVLVAAASSLEAIAGQATTAATTAAESVENLHRASTQLLCAANQQVAETSEAIGKASGRAAFVAAEQRTDLAAFGAAAEERWLELERGQSTALGVTESAATSALESGVAVAGVLASRAAEERKRAGAVHDRRVAELAAQSEAQAAALEVAQVHWREGLAEEPLAAFGSDEDLETEIANASEALALPVTDLPPRPCHQALASEFRSSAGKQESKTIVAVGPKAEAKLGFSMDENSPMAANCPVPREAQANRPVLREQLSH